MVEIQNIICGLKQLRGTAGGIQFLSRKIVADGKAAAAERPIQASSLYQGVLILRICYNTLRESLQTLLGV